MNLLGGVGWRPTRGFILGWAWPSLGMMLLCGAQDAVRTVLDAKQRSSALSVAMVFVVALCCGNSGKAKFAILRHSHHATQRYAERQTTIDNRLPSRVLLGGYVPVAPSRPATPNSHAHSQVSGGLSRLQPQKSTPEKRLCHEHEI